MLRNIKLVLEYDGTDYFGFQRQKNKPTIQEKLEKSIKAVLNSDVKLYSCGRTDSGVHARFHIVNFFAETNLSESALLKGFNSNMPKDIAIKSVRFVNNKFNARFSAKKKKYVYRIWNSEVLSPLRERYFYNFRYRLDFELMRRAAEIFVGKHDFFAFSKRRDKDENTVRIIYSVSLLKKGNEIKITVAGNSFLYNMVRIISGGIVAVGAGRITEKELKYSLKSGIRHRLIETLPAKGLCLEHVYY